MEILSIKITSKRNRPPLLNILGTILYRGIKVIFLSPEIRIDAQSFNQVTQCSKRSRILGSLWVPIRKVIHGLLWSGPCNSFWLCSSDFPSWPQHVSQMEQFICLYHLGFLTSTSLAILFFFTLIISIYQKSHALSKPVNIIARSNLTPPPVLLWLLGLSTLAYFSPTSLRVRWGQVRVWRLPLSFPAGV